MACSLEGRVLNALHATGVVFSVKNGMATNNVDVARKAAREVMKEIKNQLGDTVDFNSPEFLGSLIKTNNGVITLNHVAIRKIQEHLNNIEGIDSDTPISSINDETFGMSGPTLDGIGRLGLNPRVEEYKKQRLKILYGLNKKIYSIKFDLDNRSLDSISYQKLNDERIKAEEHAELIKDQLALLDSNPHAGFFIINAKNDFDIIKDYLDGKSVLDNDNVYRILDYYIGLANIEDNPIFSREDIVDSEGNIIPEFKELVDKFINPIRLEAERLKVKVQALERKQAYDIIKQNPSIEMFESEGKLNSIDLINDYLERGLSDTSSFDKVFMDITNGVFSTNGIIPQVMQMKLDATIADNMQHVAMVQRKLKAEVDGKSLVDRVTSVLKAKGLRWDFFYERSESGLRRDSIISPIRSSFYDAINSALAKFAYESTDANNRSSEASRDNARMLSAQERQNFLDFNAELVKPELIPDKDQALTPEQETYKKELISKIGEYAYEDVVKKVRSAKESYNAHIEAETRRLMAIEGVTNESDLSGPAKTELEGTKAQFDPSRHDAIARYRYAVFIPNIANTGTKYINNQFQAIESDKTLSEFYGVLREAQGLIKDMLPPDKQSQLGSLSLLSTEKTFWDVWGDKTIPLKERLSEAFKRFLQFFSELGHKSIRDHVTAFKVDPITGRKIYKVNDDWFKSNRSTINQIYEENLIRINHAIGKPLHYNLSRTLSKDYSNNNEVIHILSELLGVQPTRQAVEKALGVNMSEMNLHRALLDASTDLAMAEQSTDIPKLMMLQLHQAVMYKSRNDVLPELNALKDEYYKIKDKNGKERTNAIEQMESWFNRVVLDNYENNSEFAEGEHERAKNDTRETKKDSDGKDVTRLYDQDYWDEYLEKERKGRRYNKHEETRVNQLVGLINMMRNEVRDNKKLTPEEVDKITGMIRKTRDKIHANGKVFAISAVLDNLLSFLRVIGLGWNINSNITNFIEGQISNHLAAERGVYFREEHLARANHIMMNTSLKIGSLGQKESSGYRKAQVLMKLLDVQQDASNEFQKADKDSAENRLKYLNPFLFTQMTENRNQTPVMIAILLNTEIKDNNGKVSNLWDALDDKGNLKKEFDDGEGGENHEMFVKFSSKDFHALKSKINKAIIDIHGDYHDTHGNLASEKYWGKATLMFKRWMIRMLYSRFGTEQTDLESGQLVAKGRFRSLTTPQFIMGGAIMGVVFAPWMGVFGAMIGLASSYAYNRTVPSVTNANFFQDAAANLHGLVLQFLRLPVNMISGRFFGKEAIKFNNQDVFGNLGLKEVDANNIRANLAEMSLMLWLALAYLGITVMLGKGDDDEEDEWKLLRNYLLNKNMQILNQTQMYVNPNATWSALGGEIGLLQTSKRIVEFSNEFSKFVSGEKNRAWSKAEGILLPSPARGLAGTIAGNGDLWWFGLGRNSYKVFEKWGWSNYLRTPEEKADAELKSIRDKRVAEINERDDISDKQKEKLIKKEKSKWRKPKGGKASDVIKKNRRLLEED